MRGETENLKSKGGKWIRPSVVELLFLPTLFFNLSPVCNNSLATQISGSYVYIDDGLVEILILAES